MNKSDRLLRMHHMDLKKNVLKLFSGLIVYSILAFTLLISLFPILWIVISSFKSNKAILSNPFSLPDIFNIQAYIDVLTQYNFLRYFANSFIVSCTAAVAGLCIFSLAAYVFARHSFPGKTILFTLFTITLLVPGHAKAQPIFSLILNLGLYDTKSGLILVYISQGMALSIFILKTSFMTSPKELDEAALMEGANFWQIFWRINVPAARSGIITAGILMFLQNWNEYFYGVILTTSAKNRTLPVALSFFNETFSYNYTKMFSALTLAITPGILVYILTQEYIQKSASFSGLKG